MRLAVALRRHLREPRLALLQGLALPLDLSAVRLQLRLLRREGLLLRLRLAVALSRHLREPRLALLQGLALSLNVAAFAVHCLVRVTLPGVALGS